MPVEPSNFYRGAAAGVGALLLAAALSSPAAAENADRVELGVGYWDLDESEAVSFEGNYYVGTDLGWGIAPQGGIAVTSDESIYAHIGLYRQFDLSPNWFVTPALSVGAYEEGDGSDLGHTIQFRSFIELGYAFENGSALSVYFYHLSNAGLDDDNPGLETAGVAYSFAW